MLVADYREIPLKRLIQLGEEIFGLSPRTIRNHLSKTVTASFKLKLPKFKKEFKFKVFPVGFYERRKGEKIVYFIDHVPIRQAIIYLASVALLSLTAIMLILRGDLSRAMWAILAILISALGPAIVSFLAYCVRCAENIPDNKVTCIIKYRERKKDIIIRAGFRRGTRLSEVKEYAIREIASRRGRPLRGDHHLLFIGEDGRGVKVNEVKRLYSLDGQVLHFELVSSRKLSKRSPQKTFNLFEECS